jgi:hypothetical protein
MSNGSEKLVLPADAMLPNKTEVPVGICGVEAQSKRSGRVELFMLERRVLSDLEGSPLKSEELDLSRASFERHLLQLERNPKGVRTTLQMCDCRDLLYRPHR